MHYPLEGQAYSHLGCIVITIVTSGIEGWKSDFNLIVHLLYALSVSN